MQSPDNSRAFWTQALSLALCWRLAPDCGVEGLIIGVCGIRRCIGSLRLIGGVLQSLFIPRVSDECLAFPTRVLAGRVVALGGTNVHGKMQAGDGFVSGSLNLDRGWWPAVRVQMQDAQYLETECKGTRVLVTILVCLYQALEPEPGAWPFYEDIIETEDDGLRDFTVLSGDGQSIYT